MHLSFLILSHSSVMHKLNYLEQCLAAASSGQKRGNLLLARAHRAQAAGPVSLYPSILTATDQWVILSDLDQSVQLKKKITALRIFTYVEQLILSLLISSSLVGTYTLAKQMRTNEN